MADPILFRPTRQYLNSIEPDAMLRRYFEVGVNIDMDVWNDPFMGDTLHGGYQSTASGANSVAAAISTGVVGGAILLDCGDADGGRSDLSLGLHYTGSRNATVWAKVSLSAVTTMKLEVGFTDVVSGTDAGAVSVKAGNGTWTATNACILAYDTTDDTNVTLLGVKAGTAATSIDLAPPAAIALATYYWFGVSLKDDLAKGFMLNASGAKLAETAWMASAITSTTLLTPWIFAQAKAAAARTATVGHLLAYQRASTS